jgi:hypothetical protein
VLAASANLPVPEYQHLDFFTASYGGGSERSGLPHSQLPQVFDYLLATARD